MSRDRLWAVERHDGKRIALCESRHKAAGVVATCHGGQPSWYTINPVSPVSWLWWRPLFTPEWDRYAEDTRYV